VTLLTQETIRAARRLPGVAAMKIQPVVRVGLLRPVFWSRRDAAALLWRARRWSQSVQGTQRTYRGDAWHNPYTVTTFRPVR